MSSGDAPGWAAGAYLEVGRRCPRAVSGNTDDGALVHMAGANQAATLSQYPAVHVGTCGGRRDAARRGVSWWGVGRYLPAVDISYGDGQPSRHDSVPRRRGCDTKAVDLPCQDMVACSGDSGKLARRRGRRKRSRCCAAEAKRLQLELRRIS